MEIIYYLYCLAVIVISIFIIAKTGAFSKLFLNGIRKELIPLCENIELDNKYFITEFFPILGFEDSDETVVDDEQPVFYVVDNEHRTEDTQEAINDGIDYIEDGEVEATMGIPVETGIVYEREDLQNFEYLISNCYIVTSSTSVNPEEFNADMLLDMDLSIDTTTDDYKVLIFHTHGSETYSDSREGVIEDTVIGVGDELTRILEDDYGIKVYHDRNVYDMVDGTLDRSYAYDLSREAIDKILEQYPSIEVVIDLHRDGVGENVYLVTNIDGRDTAKLMFVNGVSRLNVNGDIEELYNPYKIGNLAFSLQMLLAGKKLYGDLMRNIYVTGYCYNLDVADRSALIEVGAQTNTLQEAKNAMIPLASIIYSVISEK